MPHDDDVFNYCSSWLDKWCYWQETPRCESQYVQLTEAFHSEQQCLFMLSIHTELQTYLHIIYAA